MATGDHRPATGGISQLGPGGEEGARTVTRAGGEASARPESNSSVYSFVGPLGDAAWCFEDTGQPGGHCGLKNKHVGPSLSCITHLTARVTSSLSAAAQLPQQSTAGPQLQQQAWISHVLETGSSDEGGSRLVSPEALSLAWRQPSSPRVLTQSCLCTHIPGISVCPDLLL